MNYKSQLQKAVVGIAVIVICLFYSCGYKSLMPKVTDTPLSAQKNAPGASGIELVISSTVRMKIPAEITSSEPVQCVFAHNAYSSGSDLYEATPSKMLISQAWDKLASDLKCASLLYGLKESAGPDSTSGGQQLARDINQHLSQFAEMSHRPELVNAPLVLTGLSAAGASAFWTAYAISDRIVAIVPYHGYASKGGGFSKVQDFIDTVMSQRSKMHEIPVLYVIAAADPTRVLGIQGINEKVRNNGGLWTSVIQPNTGHADMGDQTFIINWLKEIVAQRVKQEAALSTLSEQTFVGTYVLATLPNGNYYFKNPQIFSSNQYSGPLSKSIWLPSRAIANEWLSYSRSGQH